MAVPITHVEHLFPPQREILENGFLSTRDHWILCLPTGAGKTLLGEWALHDAVQLGFKGVYLSPLKAIAQEKYFEWQQKYPRTRFGLFTGDRLKEKKTPSAFRPQEADVLLCTPERFDAYLRNWRKTLSWIADLGVIILDELHLLASGQRGARLEALITRILRLNQFTRLIGLSATISNMESLAQWLNARTYHSEWRPVEIQKRVRRFKKPSEKFSLLLEELEATLSQKGKVLVFTNSRRRAEGLAGQLRGCGIRSAFHHAGLSRTDRSEVEGEFKNGDVDVLIATPTVEMGVNLPARKVVVFDHYAFSDEGLFVPLPVMNYVQRVGRAGRPGLDETGESVLLLPSWHGNATRYLEEDLEPIRSPLFSQNLLGEQVLAEVSSGLSITQRQLEKEFVGRTLWHFQGGKSCLDEEIELLKDAGMLRETPGEKKTYLNPTGIGRLAIQLFLSPRSVLVIKNFYEQYGSLRYFDLLLMAALLPECQPRLWFDFEEIDVLGDRLLSLPSHFLDEPVSTLNRILLNINERQVLSGLKIASLLHERTQGVAEDELVETYSCYPSDLRSLQDNALWLLGGISALFSAMRRQEIGDDESRGAFYHEQRCLTPLPEDLCRRVGLMVRYGIPPKMIALASIPGVGGKRVRVLWEAGYRDPEDIALAQVAELAKLPGLGTKSAGKIIENSEEVIKLEATGYEEEKIPGIKMPFSWPSGVDPYRLRRALDLELMHRGKETTIVAGGSEPRRVNITWQHGHRVYRCDCPDHQHRKLPCKHILRVQFENSEGKQLRKALREMQQVQDVPLRYALSHLWSRSMGLGFGKQARQPSTQEYSTRHVLNKASSPRR